MEMMSTSIAKLATALVAAQAEMRSPEKNASNPAFRTRYADLASIMDAAREVLPKHGLAVSQIPVPSDARSVCVRTMLLHSSGEWLAGDCVLPFGRGDGPQAAGSAITYARRYGLASMLGMVADDDDDGEAAQKSFRANGGARQAQAPAQRRAQEPAQGRPASAPTEKQVKAIWAITCNHLGTRDRDVLAGFWSEFLGRDVGSTKDFTAEDARAFLDEFGSGGGSGGRRDRRDDDEDDDVPF